MYGPLPLPVRAAQPFACEPYIRPSLLQGLERYLTSEAPQFRHDSRLQEASVSQSRRLVSHSWVELRTKRWLQLSSQRRSPPRQLRLSPTLRLSCQNLRCRAVLFSLWVKVGLKVLFQRLSYVLNLTFQASVGLDGIELRRFEVALPCSRLL